MDKNVFVNDSIGNFLNKHFINVKVQMDKTEKDDESIKRWYDDADSISKKYRVDRMPSYLFFSPQGVLLEQETGYKRVGEFLDIAQSVIRPGRAYKGTYAEYDRLVEEYKNGIIHYDRLVYMINIAKKFDTALVQPLTKQFADYVSKLDANKRYTKENIEFWNMYVLKSSSIIFNYFYKDGKQIDEVMQQKGYAAAVIDRTIYYELIIPFFEEENLNREIPMTGMYLSGLNLKTDSSEANWKKLEKGLRNKFNRETAKRNVLAARIEWYARHWNYDAYCKNILIQFDKYPTDIKKQYISINRAAWKAFINVKERKILNGYIRWMSKVVTYYPESGYCLDTYANLLYKVGRKKDAIIWEEKAMLTGDSNVSQYKVALDHMRRGEPTYGVNIE
jgi:thioredoxin-related protein